MRYAHLYHIPFIHYDIICWHIVLLTELNKFALVLVTLLHLGKV